MTKSPGARPPGVVALGASAGGLDALQRSVAALGADFPLAIVVVVHIPAASRSLLADIIARRTALSVTPARDGEPLQGRHIFVAPPDRHVLVTADRLVLDRGPKENGARPAIDPLFRSLAHGWGSRGLAVVLSGALADGASGAAAMAAAGGTVLVQDPADAVVASMPEAALRAVPSARALAAGDIGAALVAFAEGLADLRERPNEAAEAPASSRPPAGSGRPSWPPSGLARPTNRPLGRRDAGGAVQCRYRFGHAFGEDVLLEPNGGEIGAAMWSAVEALEEYTEVLRTVAARTLDAGRVKAAALLLRRAERPDVARRVPVAAAAHHGRGTEVA